MSTCNTSMSQFSKSDLKKSQLHTLHTLTDIVYEYVETLSHFITYE